MLKNYFIDITKNAIEKAIELNELGETKELTFDLVCDTPKNKDFGDFAINISALAKTAKMAPPKIAETIAKHIPVFFFEINIVAGFINFKIGKEYLNEIIQCILDDEEEFLKTDIGKGEKVNIEYVSANPTGPFHIGHGRWAALGSALANIMKYCNYDVFQEFYINDAGNQINKLGKSLEVRVRQLQGENIELEEDMYPGEY